jgi:hypothetical protein
MACIGPPTDANRLGNALTLGARFHVLMGLTNTGSFL